MVLHVVIVACDNCSACRSFWPPVDPLSALLGLLPHDGLPREPRNWSFAQELATTAGPMGTPYPTVPREPVLSYGGEEKPLPKFESGPVQPRVVHDVVATQVIHVVEGDILLLDGPMVPKEQRVSVPSPGTICSAAPLPVSPGLCTLQHSPPGQ